MARRMVWAAGGAVGMNPCGHCQQKAEWRYKEGAHQVKK